jgi:carbamoyltransferase
LATTKPIYILGTGLSHDGSVCILKDGKIAIAIEKERLTRNKHDGGNDSLAINYCLDTLDIRLSDLSLVVQCANFEKDIQPDSYKGLRPFPKDFPVVTISHHLAHAYSAIGTSPFRASNVLVIDGAGSPAIQCDDWPDGAVKDHWLSQVGFYCEKDSFYHYDGIELKCLQKDFSELKMYAPSSDTFKMPTNYHSIGGVYAAASHYCFGNLDDAGKLMGLAPYGSGKEFHESIFDLDNGIVKVLHDSFKTLTHPSENYEDFIKNFNHYAEVAHWVQAETERAVAYVAAHRMNQWPHSHLCYAGGVALNAVANALLLKQKIADHLYLQPAAADNGLSIGCAFYGWHHLLQKEILHRDNQPVFFGKSYSSCAITTCLKEHDASISWQRSPDYIQQAAKLLAEGKVVGWFQQGAEFGPRALGHRSILADPRRKDIRTYINAAIKFREDFRPFAPAVLKEEASTYFKYGWNSPYMILVDEIRDEWKDQLPGIVHVDGTCRVQTVDKDEIPLFHTLLKQFKKESGIPVLVNTSFNRRGMPIVETPEQAVKFFLECALDVLVMEDIIARKK